MRGFLPAGWLAILLFCMPLDPAAAAAPALSADCPAGFELSAGHCELRSLTDESFKPWEPEQLPSGMQPVHNDIATAGDNPDGELL